MLSEAESVDFWSNIILFTSDNGNRKQSQNTKGCMFLRMHPVYGLAVFENMYVYNVQFTILTARRKKLDFRGDVLGSICWRGAWTACVRGLKGVHIWSRPHPDPGLVQVLEMADWCWWFLTDLTQPKQAVMESKHVLAVPRGGGGHFSSEWRLESRTQKWERAHSIDTMLSRS